MGISHCFRQLPPLRDPRPVSPPEGAEMIVECCICHCSGYTTDIELAGWTWVTRDELICKSRKCARELVRMLTEGGADSA